jgi:hypothetical protein
MEQYQPNPPDASEIPFGFTEADDVHEKTWEEKYHADAETLKTRGFTSDFCGAWIALWSSIALEYGPALEAESARMRARKELPGESCEQILEKARRAYMAVMGAAVRSDKQRTRLRRFKASALYLEATRRGVSYDFESMSPEERQTLQSNLRRYWREAWTYISLVQRVMGLPLVERERRSFKASAGKPDAAHYTDRLSDLIGGIIAEKNKARGGNRLQRFERATRVRLTAFRDECEHFCPERKDADGKECQRPHLITPAKGGPDPEADEKQKSDPSPPRAKVLPFSKAAEKLTDGVRIILDRAAWGLLTREEAEEAVMMFAPVVALVAATEGTPHPHMDGGVPYADFATDEPALDAAPDAELVERASDGICDFTAENAQVEGVNADKFIRAPASAPDLTTVTLDDFLSAFFPDPCEDINLRAFGPKDAPEDEARFRARKWRTRREALACDAALLAELHEANRTCGIYFVVNSGGDCAEDITRINGFFAEMDDGALASQHAKYDASPLMPAVRIETLKSVHGHWPAAPGVTLDEFGEIQRRLIHHFKSDPKIKDRSRVMRLPGFNHVAYNAALLSYKPVTLAAFDPSHRFTAAEMFAAFPAAPATKPKPQREPKTLEQLSGDLEGFKRELGLRIMSHSTARHNGRGNWDCRAVCHNGKGASGLFYDPSGNFVWCNAESSCALETIGIAFGVKRARGAA